MSEIAKVGAVRDSSLKALLGANPDLNIPVHQYNINVASLKGEQIEAKDLFREIQEFPGRGTDAHLYFHLPLCDYICHFCNYVKRLVAPETRLQQLDLWANRLIAESELYLRQVPWMTDINITSFYIGGGTGAIFLSNEAALRRLLDHVRDNYQITDDCELSLEGNPENFTDASIEFAQSLGFNRFSVGVQSLNDEVNSYARRGHTREEALRAINVLLKTGRPFSVDMMFGLPHQSVEGVRDDILTLIEMGVPTITIYRLRNAERDKMGLGNTSVWNTVKIRDKLDSKNLLPSVTKTYQMREAIMEVFAKYGYSPSPCGWWNRPNVYPNGNIPRVSRDKWQRYQSMIGFGPGAYGWLTGNETTFLQTHNQSDISAYAKYIDAKPELPPLAFGRRLAGNRAIGTKLCFAYKANQPIYRQEFFEQFGIDLLSDEPFRSTFTELIDKGFMSRNADADYWIPTLAGEALHEEIMYVYFHERVGGCLDAVCRRTS